MHGIAHLCRTDCGSLAELVGVVHRMGARRAIMRRRVRQMRQLRRGLAWWPLLPLALAALVLADGLGLLP